MKPQRPLLKKRIVSTRAEVQAKQLLNRLRALGATALSCPAIAFAPPESFAPFDRAVRSLDNYDWVILTSANGVNALMDRMRTLKVDNGPLHSAQVGTIGPATAAELRRYGITPSFMPDEYVAEAILEQIGDVQGKRVLLPRADIAREALAVGLRERGANVDEIAAYRTIHGPGGERLVQELGNAAIDAVTFTSSSTVRFLLDGMADAGLGRPESVALLNQSAVVCIGPITADTARDEGLRVDAVAETYTEDGLIDTLVAYFR